MLRHPANNRKETTLRTAALEVTENEEQTKHEQEPTGAGLRALASMDVAGRPFTALSFPRNQVGATGRQLNLLAEAWHPGRARPSNESLQYRNWRLVLTMLKMGRSSGCR